LGFNDNLKDMEGTLGKHGCPPYLSRTSVRKGNIESESLDT